MKHDVYSGEPEARPVIGLALASITDPRDALVWSGAVQAARDNDVDLICFPVGYGGSPNAAIWDLVHADTVDGLVMHVYASPKDLMDLERALAPLPIVNTLRLYEGYPGISADNYQGMRNLIVHMADVHGCRAMAFVRGPEGNPSADDRFRAYVDVLAERGLEFDQRLVYTGLFSEECGLNAVRCFFDDRALQLDAIIASADAMAIGALRELGRRGLKVPYDIAVTGFDDILDSQFTDPPLTTVAQPWYEMGRRAVEHLLTDMGGGSQTEHVLLPCEVRLRRSCRCWPAAVVEAKVQGAGDEDMDDLALEGTKTGLLEAFANTVRGASSESFLVKAEQTFRASVEQSDRVDALQALLSELGRCVPGLAAHDPQATIRGADALNQARVLANEVALWSEHRKIVEADERAAAIRQFGQRLAALYDEQRLNEILVSEMPALDIPGFYLVRYEPQQRSDLWAQIMAAYTGKGRIDPALSGRHFQADRLLPSGALVQPECQNLLVQMIEFQNTRIGYAVFELGPLDGELYTSLSEQLGAAMWGLRLTESERRRTLQLQTAAELGQVATLLLDPDDLMQRAVDLALQRLDLYYAGVFLVDDEGKWTGEPGRWAVLRAGTGQAGREMLARRHKLEIGGSSMIGQCIVQKHERVALEVQRESSRFDNPFLPHTHSELALPLISRGRAIGAMTIQSTLPGDFDRQDIATLQLLADQLANAIQTTRLFAASQKALQHTLMLYETGRTLSTSLDEDSLIRAILDNISRELGCEYAIVSTVDRDAGVISSRHGIWQGEHNVFPEWMIKSTYDLDSTDILADVCRTACTEVISGWDDRFNKEIYEQYDHQRLLRMFVPIQVRDRVLGVIEVAYDRDIKGHIGQDEIELVQALVDQMAVALENARLLTVTRQALQETERLYETNQRIAAANTATEMLAAVVKGCGLPVLTRALLWLADLDDDGSRQAFVPVAEWRVGEGVGMSPGERSIVAQEESLSSPRYVTDVKREKAISDEIHSVIEARQIVSLALLPIANGQRQIGLLMLAGDGRHAYSESERRRLASLVDQLAVGLDRIDLTHQVQNSLRREQALREMTQRVRSAVDVQDVMRVAVQETGRLLGRTAFIHLGDPAAFDWIAGDEQHGS